MDVMATLYRIKEFIVAGIQSLPIIIGGISLLLACGTANTGYAIVFSFMALVVPMTVFLLNKAAPLFQMLINWIRRNIFKLEDLSFMVPDNGICKIVQSSATSPGIAFPSYWMASVVFFFSFVFFNGLSLYNYTSSETADGDKVNARKTHAIIGMVLSALIGFGLVIWRITTGCEHKSFLGVIFGLLFIGLAYGLYTAFEKCGLIRVIDLYGVGARLLPRTATEEPTQVCFPVAENS
jgi:hypothetical protein